jgi:hypothetical protein
MQTHEERDGERIKTGSICGVVFEGRGLAKGSRSVPGLTGYVVCENDGVFTVVRSEKIYRTDNPRLGYRIRMYLKRHYNESVNMTMYEVDSTENSYVNI